MSVTHYLVPALLVSLLAGCASTTVASSSDPVRARVLAELEQARKDGSYPPSEADYVTPNWVRIASPAGVLMTDGHPEYQATPHTAAVAAQPAVTVPAATVMTDASSGYGAARDTVKGGVSAH